MKRNFFKNVIIFISFNSLGFSADFNVELDNDVNIQDIQIKGRRSDPRYKNDYYYLNHLSDILYFQYLKSDDFSTLSKDERQSVISLLIKRMAGLMVGYGTGLKKRPKADINPENYWQTVLNIKHMAWALRKSNSEIKIAKLFRELASHKEKLHLKDVNDEEFKTHIDILTSLGIAADESVKLDELDGQPDAHPVEERAQDTMKKAAIDDTIIQKSLDIARHYGLFYKTAERFSYDLQNKRVIDFVTFRQSKGLPSRLAYFVTNRFNGSERRRFHDGSWVFCDEYTPDLNPAGHVYVNMDVTALSVWRVRKLPDSLLFDEIAADTSSKTQLTLRSLFEALCVLKPGGTIQIPLEFDAWGIIGVDREMDPSLPLGELAKKFVQKLGSFDDTGSWVLDRDEFDDWVVLPFYLRWPNNIPKDVREKLGEYVMDHYICPFYEHGLKVFRLGRKDKPFFSKVEVKKNAQHHLGIYEEPVEWLFIGTK